MSDLHHNFYNGVGGENVGDVIPTDGYDVLILAGDIDESTNFLEVVCQNITKPILFIMGNHEYHHHYEHYSKVEESYKVLSDKYPHLTVFTSKLGSIIIDGVLFFGGVSWPYIPYSDKQYIEHSISDYRISSLTVNTTNYINTEFTDCLNTTEQLLRSGSLKGISKIVGLTHFIPDTRLIDEKWVGNPLNVYFVSSIDTNLFKHCDYWFFGHGHDKVDKTLDGCRFVANPRGYPHENQYINYEGRIIEL